MSDDEFYDELISFKRNKNKLLDNLFAKPIKDKGLNKPHFQYVDENITHQADILYLPNDNNYKYALVVVDIHDRKTDARPLKSKSSAEVLKAFQSIYKGTILKIPMQIQVNNGTEFKGDVANYFNDEGVSIKVGLPDRHRQQAIVEQKNFSIERAIHRRQAAQELITGVQSTEWIDDLPKIIKAINRLAKPKKPKKQFTTPICEGDSCILFNIGDKVRVALDAPITATEEEKKLHGKFRASDIRWDKTPRTIENVYLTPNMPPLYEVSGITKAVYTKNQLQLIPTKEDYPDTSKFIRGKPNIFKVEKIINKKKVGNKIYYQVKWLGYNDKKDYTWEPRTNLIKDVPDIVADYERSNK